MIILCSGDVSICCEIFVVQNGIRVTRVMIFNAINRKTKLSSLLIEYYFGVVLRLVKAPLVYVFSYDMSE